MNDIKIHKLNCISCNSNLEVPSDVTKFNCGYCGTQLIVEKSGGIIALREVVDAIGRVQTGTDKTAAELALQRLPVELSNIQKERDEKDQYWQHYISEQLRPIEKKLENEKFGGVGCGCGTLIVLCIITYFIGHNSNLGDSIVLGIVLFISIFILPIIIGFWVHKHSMNNVAQLTKDKNDLIAKLNSQKSFELNQLDIKINEIKTIIEKNRKIVNLL